MIRIAKVKANGRRYIVQQIQFARGDKGGDKVHVWGEVVGFKYDKRTERVLSYKCDGSKTFLLEAVEINEVEQTESLFKELFEQAAEIRKAAGLPVAVRGGTLVAAKTKKREADREEFNAMLDEAASSLQLNGASTLGDLLLSRKA
jgi:hypothetical protein